MSSPTSPSYLALWLNNYNYNIHDHVARGAAALLELRDPLLDLLLDENLSSHGEGART